MSGLLSDAGFVVLLAALVGVCKGSVRSLRLTGRRQCAQAAAAAFAVMVLGGALAPAPEPTVDQVAQDRARPAPATTRPAAPAPDRAVTPRAPAATTAPAAPPTAGPPEPPKPARTRATLVPLLVVAAGGDGDSWRDTNGVEYRMGLINTPETNECGGAAATAYRKRALAGGFRAAVYATDDYGRKVAVITAPNGVNLNVAMARDGIADDRYLQRFRHENPRLAAQLDVAFAEARAAGRGIWTSCGSGTTTGAAPQQPPPAAAGAGCHPDYRTCIPVAGDGSGRGAANDLDCGEIGQTVYLRQIGRDPYRLDGRDQDGVACE